MVETAQADGTRTYRETEPQFHRCNERVGGCGEVVKVRVAIHEGSGVAGFTCPLCDKTQEPNPADGFEEDGR